MSRRIPALMRHLVVGASPVVQAIYPWVPTKNPTLGPLVYEEILDHLLAHDHAMFLSTISKVRNGERSRWSGVVGVV